MPQIEVTQLARPATQDNLISAIVHCDEHLTQCY